MIRDWCIFSDPEFLRRDRLPHKPKRPYHPGVTQTKCHHIVEGRVVQGLLWDTDGRIHTRSDGGLTLRTPGHGHW